MKKSLPLAVATALAAGVTLLPSSASAAPITGKDVPSLKQMTKIFPGFKPGVASTYSSKSLPIPTNVKTCNGTPKFVKGTSGVGAIYWSRPKNPNGKLPRATAHVVRFKKLSTAKAIINRTRAFDRTCHGQANPTEVRLKAIGDDRYADRNTAGSTRYAEVWVRKGRTVVYTEVVTAKPVSAAKLNTLARVALHRAL